MNTQPYILSMNITSPSESTRRRKWTEDEDEMLQIAIKQEHPQGGVPFKWQEVAKYIPGRSNKDCRKRWYNKMSAPQSARGTWTAEEDVVLIEAVRTHGANWSAVASMVGTRKSCQCARRWYDALDPSIDKAPWSDEEEELLLSAVKEHGRKWAYISKTYFPRRTALATKNRFVTIVTSASHPRRSTCSRNASPQYIPGTPMNQYSPSPYGYEELDLYHSDVVSSSFSNSSYSAFGMDSANSSPELPAPVPQFQNVNVPHGHMINALDNFEYQLALELEAASWSQPASPVSSQFSSRSGSPYGFVNQEASKWAAGTFDPWDPEVLRLMQAQPLIVA